MWGAKINPVISMHTFETSPFAGFGQRPGCNREFLILTQISPSLSLGVPPEVPPVVREQARARGAGVPVVAPWASREPWRNVGQTCAKSAVSVSASFTGPSETLSDR